MAGFRKERSASFIQEQLTLFLRQSVKDPDVKALTITTVDMTPDLRVARVYVSSYEGEDELQAGLKGLERAKGFLRRELSKTLSWRFTPHIEFRPDRSWEYGSKIDSLLATVHEQDAAREKTEEENDQPAE